MADEHEHNDNGRTQEATTENKTQIVVYLHTHCTCGALVNTDELRRIPKAGSSPWD